MENKRPSKSRLLFWSGCFFLAVFAGITLLFLVRRSGDFVNAQEQKDLSQGKDLEKTDLSEGWPGWRGPLRDGHSAGKDLLLNWETEEPPILWRVNIGDGFGSMAVAPMKDGSRVLTMFQEGDQEVVGCWNAETGKELWLRKYNARFQDRFGAGPRGTPLVHDGLVYTVGGSGVVHCLDVKNGDVRWRLDLKETYGVGDPTWGFSFSPLVAGDLLLLVPGGKSGNALAAVNRKTGKKEWQALDVGGGYSSPILTHIGGQEQALFFTGTGLVSVVPQSGEKLWEYPWDTNYEANIATPIVFEKINKGNLNHYVFISSGYGSGCALLRVEKQGEKFRVEPVYKHRKMNNHFSSSLYFPREGSGYLFGFHEATLVCLDVTDDKGRAKWSERDFERGHLLAVAGHLIVLGENGRLAVVEATPNGYAEKGRMQIFDGPLVWSAPALAEGLLFVRDRKELVCLDLRVK